MATAAIVFATLLSCHARRVQPALLLVVADTLRADRLGAYGYRARATSPRIDSWSARGRVYERAIAPSPWTVPSFGTLLTGLDPRDHGAGVRSRGAGAVPTGGLAEQHPTLAERLASRGYRTAAFVANPFLDPVMGFGRGFQRYQQFARPGEPLPSAREMIPHLLSWLDAADSRPAFALLVLYDVHMPYRSPPPFGGRFMTATSLDPRLVDDPKYVRSQLAELSAGQRETIDAAYDEGVAYLDSELGRLLGELERRAFLDDGLVVLTSDHGEELFEHGGFEHGHRMWQQLLHVPLIVWGGGVRAGREATAVGLADVHATLLDAARASANGHGRSLLPNLFERAPLAERTYIADANLYGPMRAAAIRWPHKRILNQRTRSSRTIDLTSDPREAAGNVEIGQAASAVLDAALRERTHPPGARSPTPQAPLAPELREQLENLGYDR